ncbi:cysteine-rich CWC family protein [Paenibacillus daejeonensis]|uniref:cysteine-rich CWC family protein n=1 Tax=Paenibacillus daejeonensis TaxID=135193 RepID=UPI000379D076|nr:cysteine-rich CWC family protein [Paenibacillus daejeonensis]
MRPQLILDMAGVLVTNLSPGFWETAGQLGGMPGAALKTRFRAEVRDAFWSGQMRESEFWDWLGAIVPSADGEPLRSALCEQLQPLPALAAVADWSRVADIHLLTNHRREWLAELVEPLKPYLASVTISSEAGRCKPDPELYAKLHRTLPLDVPILYVDDQAHNLTPAQAMGWQTVLADGEGKWMRQVDTFLGEATTPETVDEARCPLCGGDNRCGVLEGADIRACWCMSTAIPRQLRDRVPAEQAGKACICAACVARYHEERLLGSE